MFLIIFIFLRCSNIFSFLFCVVVIFSLLISEITCYDRYIITCHWLPKAGQCIPHFDPINKHPLRCLRLTSAGRSFITCDVTTDDGATLYVYVTIYAAIRCEGKSGRACRLHPALLIAVKSRTTIKVAEPATRWWRNTLRLRHNICSDSLQEQIWACPRIKSCVVDWSFVTAS